MDLTAFELCKLASVVKHAQMPLHLNRKHHKYDPAYLDYGRSLHTQIRHHPKREGVQRAIGTGTLGAVLGALIAKTMSDDPKALITGALAGGVTGAVPGYQSGKHEAESENTRINFLRRRGITHPGELELLEKHVPAIAKVKEVDV